ncbi:hypothetical protein M2271_006471 [Streptomyces sp. LBL]|uniref:hypothetical protein n=1 Tax=Streptomyces sp. LBL TaxID=2940562 RepID=UPI00247C0B50|nr:hypothetical protein [Streptomyces sp. LBL]
MPALLAASDVLGTGWYAVVTAEPAPARPLRSSGTAPSASWPSSPPPSSWRCTVAEERGEEGIAKIKTPTSGLSAHSEVSAVGTQESFMQADGATRGGGHLGYVGVHYDVTSPGIELFFASIHTLGRPGPGAPAGAGLMALIRLAERAGLHGPATAIRMRTPATAAAPIRRPR